MTTAIDIKEWHKKLGVHKKQLNAVLEMPFTIGPDSAGLAMLDPVTKTTALQAKAKFLCTITLLSGTTLIQWRWAYADKWNTPAVKRKTLAPAMLNCTGPLKPMKERLARIVDQTSFLIRSMQEQDVLMALCAASWNFDHIFLVQLGPDPDVMVALGLNDIKTGADVTTTTLHESTETKTQIIHAVQEIDADKRHFEMTGQSAMPTSITPSASSTLMIAPSVSRQCGNDKCPHRKSKKKYVQLDKCSQCKNVEYCSVDCQRMHWKTHKKQCKKSKPVVVVAAPVMDDLSQTVD